MADNAHDFSSTRLAIFGPGLLGGSLLLAGRALGIADIRIWGRSERSIAEAAPFADLATTDVAAAAKGADFLILCVPVEAMPALAVDLCRSRSWAPTAIVTDVGSVKGMVMRHVAPIFAQAGVDFVGSHPMAGSERAGFAQAKADLFVEAPCIVVPSENAAATARVVAFWEALGSRVTRMEAARHDHVVARVSHLPRVAAAATLFSALGRDASDADFAANGLKDTVRVAGGEAPMWRGILEANRDAVLPCLVDLRDAIDDFIELLRREDGAGLEKRLAEAKALRAQHLPPRQPPLP
jgi:prephenate dehydrogenase